METNKISRPLLLLILLCQISISPCAAQVNWDSVFTCKYSDILHSVPLIRESRYDPELIFTAVVITEGQALKYHLKYCKNSFDIIDSISDTSAQTRELLVEDCAFKENGKVSNLNMFHDSTTYSYDCLGNPMMWENRVYSHKYVRNFFGIGHDVNCLYRSDRITNKILEREISKDRIYYHLIRRYENSYDKQKHDSSDIYCYDSLNGKRGYLESRGGGPSGRRDYETDTSITYEFFHGTETSNLDDIPILKPYMIYRRYIRYDSVHRVKYFDGERVYQDSKKNPDQTPAFEVHYDKENKISLVIVKYPRFINGINSYYFRYITFKNNLPVTLCFDDQLRPEITIHYRKNLLIVSCMVRTATS